MRLDPVLFLFLSLLCSKPHWVCAARHAHWWVHTIAVIVQSYPELPLMKGPGHWHSSHNDGAQNQPPVQMVGKCTHIYPESLVTAGARMLAVGVVCGQGGGGWGLAGHTLGREGQQGSYIGSSRSAYVRRPFYGSTHPLRPTQTCASQSEP